MMSLSVYHRGSVCTRSCFHDANVTALPQGNGRLGLRFLLNGQTSIRGTGTFRIHAESVLWEKEEQKEKKGERER